MKSETRFVENLKKKDTSVRNTIDRVFGKNLGIFFRKILFVVARFNVYDGRK